MAEAITLRLSPIRRLPHRSAREAVVTVAGAPAATVVAGTEGHLRQALPPRLSTATKSSSGQARQACPGPLISAATCSGAAHRIARLTAPAFRTQTRVAVVSKSIICTAARDATRCQASPVHRRCCIIWSGEAMSSLEHARPLRPGMTPGLAFELVALASAHRGHRGRVGGGLHPCGTQCRHAFRRQAQVVVGGTTCMIGSRSEIPVMASRP